MEKFARRCDITGKGMNAGFVIGDGEMYIAEESDLLAHLRELDWEDSNGVRSKDIESDEDLKEYFYNEEYYYYTKWEEINDDYFYDAEGNEYEV